MATPKATTWMTKEESQYDGEEMEVEKEHLSSTEKPMEEEDEHDEDPSNRQRAWEILELVKNIYTKRIATPMKFNTPARSENVRKICDVLLTLGEVSIENENYTQDVEDLNSCLEKRKDKLSNDVSYHEIYMILNEEKHSHDHHKFCVTQPGSHAQPGQE